MLFKFCDCSERREERRPVRGQLHAVRPEGPGDEAERGVLPLLPGAVGTGGERLPASACESDKDLTLLPPREGNQEKLRHKVVFHTILQGL